MCDIWVTVYHNTKKEGKVKSCVHMINFVLLSDTLGKHLRGVTSPALLPGGELQLTTMIMDR
jgi:hypothetical protein